MGFVGSVSLAGESKGEVERGLGPLWFGVMISGVRGRPATRRPSSFRFKELFLAYLAPLELPPEDEDPPKLPLDEPLELPPDELPPDDDPPEPAPRSVDPGGQGWVPVLPELALP